MLIKLEFTIPEEREEYEDSYNGPNYRAALQHLDVFLRNRLEHGGLGKQEEKAYRDISDALHEAAEMFGVCVYD